MAHFKCVTCKLRLRTTAAPENLVGDLCPGCGRLLEPVGELAEIVGFRVMEDQPRLEAGLWLDDAGDVSSAAMARAVVLPLPTEKP